MSARSLDWKTRRDTGVGRRTFFRLVGGGAGLALGRKFLPSDVAIASSVQDQATLVVGTYFIVHTLDPGRTIEITSLMVDHVLYDTLVRFEGEDVKTPKPSVATSWKLSSDGKTYTFTLRPNIKFSSGNTLTSGDVKWTLDRVRNLKATTRFFVDGIEEIQTPDPSTVVIRMKDPQPSIVPILAGPSLGILDSKLVMENGGDASPDASEKDKADTYLNSHSAGSGSFTLSSHTPGQEIVLVRNPNHWRSPSRIERVVVRNVPEAATQKLLVDKGDIDIATDLGQEQIQALRKTQGVTVKGSPLAAITYIQIDTSPEVGGPFANPKVQQAMRYSLDYAGIMAIAGQGAVRLAGLMPIIFPGAPDQRFAFRTDRVKAAALLKESGLTDIKGRLTFIDRVSYGIPQSLLAQKIQADLAAVGISVELNGLPAALAVQEWRAGKIQLASFGWTADYPDGRDYLIFLPGGNIGKRVHWSEDSSPAARDLAKLGHDAATEMDSRKRVALYEQAERRLAEIGPYIPLFNPTVVYAFRSNLRNVAWHSVWSVDLYPISRAT